MERIQAYAKYHEDPDVKGSGSFTAFYNADDKKPIPNFWDLHLCTHDKDLKMDDPDHALKTFDNPDKIIDGKRDPTPHKQNILECWVSVPDA